MNENVQRTFILGDEWVYVKIYAGYKIQDIVLKDILPEIISEMQKDRILNKWFFIRYSDPHSHLRIRFRVTHPKNILKIIASINKAINPFVSQDLVWKVQYDTYHREIERYGLKSIEFSETIFYLDSQSCLAILKKLNNDLINEKRWQISLIMVDCLLNDFNFDLERKFKLMNKYINGFLERYGHRRNSVKIQLDKKYRVYRGKIEDVFKYYENGVNWVNSFNQIISIKSRKTKKIANELLELNRNNKLEILLDDLLGSYLHMMLNRIFCTQQNQNEMVIYSLLFKYYTSKIAIKKKSYQMI